MDFAGSFNKGELPKDCGVTGFRPEIRVSSTRRRMRSCSRSSLQEFQRAAAFCKIPSFSTAASGPLELLAQACVPAKENRVVMNREVKNSATATTVAPQKLNPVRRLFERSDPSIPPGGIAPRSWGKCQSERREGSESSRSA